jgi:hypothetical protein
VEELEGMRTTIARIGALGAGAVLAVGLFATAPAGANGSSGHGVNREDSTCFTATGHTQGRSHSDPDGMSNGGADKPGCPGGSGVDQDGNNGCGNDADREDDNNGNCGRQKTTESGPGVTAPSTSTTTTSSSSSTTTTTGGPAVTVAPTAELSDCQVDPKEATDCPASAQAAGTGARLSVAAATPATGAAAAGSTGAAGTTAATNADTGATTTTTAPATEVLGEQISRPSALARTGAGVGAMALLGVVLCGGGRLAVLARRLLRIG